MVYQYKMTPINFAIYTTGRIIIQKCQIFRVNLVCLYLFVHSYCNLMLTTNMVANVINVNQCHQCSPLRQKFMECSINNPAQSLLMKHLVIGQREKAPYFSAFHWSPHSSLVSIGQHFVTTRVVHLPKRTETSLITESDQSKPNHQLCTAGTAWSDSDQAVRAVHSCNSWFCNLNKIY